MKSARDIGVIFDMDGVLVDSAAPHKRSWQLLAGELGRTVTEEEFRRTFGRQNRDIIPLVFGETSEDRIRELADRKEEIYRQLVRDDPPIVSGAVELVRGLAELGVRLAVGSSGPRANIDLILTAMDAHRHLSVIVSGEDVSRGKPHPDVFLLAAERLEIVPERCVVIEDAPFGVEAAKRAGMRCVAVLTYHPRDVLAEADLVVDTLADVTAEDVVSLIPEGNETRA